MVLHKTSGTTDLAQLCFLSTTRSRRHNSKPLKFVETIGQSLLQMKLFDTGDKITERILLMRIYKRIMSFVLRC
jgi:hypothetical protein